MIIKENESLSNHTTFKIGGKAKQFFIPESKDELVNLLNNLDEYRILGGGSNLLINDNNIFNNVIKLDKFDQSIEYLGEGKYYVGASLRIQKLINIINANGFGGIEYLFSVPGLVGGAVVMNAGRGKQFNNQISDYIISVDVFHNGKIITLNKKECFFEYRNSIFKNKNYVILGILFKFIEIPKELSEAKKRERIKICNEKQDKYGTNFGSVFINYDTKIIKLLARIIVTKRGGVKLSRKTNNWICNGGKGTYKDTIKLIEFIEKVHKIFRKDIDREVIIWD